MTNFCITGPGKYRQRNGGVAELKDIRGLVALGIDSTGCEIAWRINSAKIHRNLIERNHDLIARIEAEPQNLGLNGYLMRGAYSSKIIELSTLTAANLVQSTPDAGVSATATCEQTDDPARQALGGSPEPVCKESLQGEDKAASEPDIPTSNKVNGSWNSPDWAAANTESINKFEATNGRCEDRTSTSLLEMPNAKALANLANDRNAFTLNRAMAELVAEIELLKEVMRIILDNH